MVAKLLAKKDNPSYLQGSSALCQVVSLLSLHTGESLSGKPACLHAELERPPRHREGASGSEGWVFLQHAVHE